MGPLSACLSNPYAKTFSMSQTSFRDEKDSMGVVRVPASAYYGPQTQRAVENFPIGELRLPLEFIRALALIKRSAAEVNRRLGLLEPGLAQAIATAAGEVLDGRHDAQFVVDVFQTGSGTSTNMNANEVIATRANAILTGTRAANRRASQRSCQPQPVEQRCDSDGHSHRRGCEARTKRFCPGAGHSLHQALDAKAPAVLETFVKIGRTHLQDAVPMRLGQEFGGYARQVELRRRAAGKPSDRLYELRFRRNRGRHGHERSSAIRAAPPSPSAPRNRPAFREAQNHFEAQAARDAVVEASGALKTLPSRSPRSPTTSAGWAPDRAAAWAKSTSRTAAGIEHHAGQGEPGDPREVLMVCRPGDRQRRRPSPGAAVRRTSS